MAKILQEYECIPGVPVLDEHDVKDKDGKILRSYRRKELEEIAAECNRRERETGDLSPFGPGHTLSPPAKETDQPPIWGFYRNYRVGTFGPQNKVALLCDRYVKKEFKEQDAQFPRRSVELWVKDKFIDWIAHLKRTPERDLGLVTYAKGQKYRYSMESDVETLGTPADGKPAVADPTKPPDKDAIDPEFHEKFMKSCRAEYPHLDGMHDKYAMEMGEGPEGRADGEDDPSGKIVDMPDENDLRLDPENQHLDDTGAEKKSAALSGTNGFLPGTTGAEKERMAKTQQEIDLLKYQKRVTDAEARAKAAEDRIAKSEQAAKLAKYERDLTGLLAQDCHFDLAEMLDECKDFTPEQFEKKKTFLVKYTRGPGAEAMIPIDNSSTVTTAGKGGKSIEDEVYETAKPLDDETETAFDRKLRYQRQHGFDGTDEKASHYAKNGRG